MLEVKYLGPDIRTINYPQNIEGEDFKGFDVDLNI